ncbi:hypothetical protein LZ32DRAFT_323405 [Colletotrichum eremochloae]|nr:hypothetical protein LZ32DRAFT_323405 [Colletotrichum eremochloae]
MDWTRQCAIRDVTGSKRKAAEPANEKWSSELEAACSVPTARSRLASIPQRPVIVRVSGNERRVTWSLGAVGHSSLKVRSSKAHRHLDACGRARPFISERDGRAFFRATVLISPSISPTSVLFFFLLFFFFCALGRHIHKPGHGQTWT